MAWSLTHQVMVSRSGERFVEGLRIQQRNIENGLYISGALVVFDKVGLEGLEEGAVELCFGYVNILRRIGSFPIEQ